MLPFPPKLEIPKLKKYKGRGYSIKHMHKFSVSFMDVQKNDSYMMRLFPRSLNGPAMDWFSHLELEFKIFDDLLEISLNHLSFNIEQYVTISYLYKLK